MKFVLLCCALLAGCATTGTQPPQIKIPVPVPCKTEEPVQPSYRFSPPYEKTFEAVRDLLGDREAALAYENELRIALKSCK